MNAFGQLPPSLYVYPPDPNFTRPAVIDPRDFDDIPPGGSLDDIYTPWEQFFLLNKFAGDDGSLNHFTFVTPAGHNWLMGQLLNRRMVFDGGSYGLWDPRSREPADTATNQRLGTIFQAWRDGGAVLALEEVPGTPYLRFATTRSSTPGPSSPSASASTYW